MPAGNPTTKKRLLGREIAYMIDKTGISQTQAAKILETSQSRIAGLLNGTGTITPGDLTLLATGLGFTDPDYLEVLRELRRDYHKRGFWNTGHRRAYSEDIRLRIDLEQHADKFSALEVEIVFGLFQCESYVRALHADEPNINDVSLEDMIQARLARQQILDTSNPPSMHVVLSESCLRRVWGGPEVMREQIDHLIKLSNRPNIFLQVMPFDQPAGRRSPIGCPFVVLRVPTPGRAGPLEMAYVEGQGEIRYVDDEDSVRVYEDAWARLSNAALRYDETRSFLTEVDREFANRSA
ncbi:helix-turn-helix domain-containing protein [Sciscionella marina]|uniref:helix-turn-helix domain-containing protein n=1 Tax=Sciscionella marina TaxID=508770 RepID=UPI00039A0539|nr:helix-turn-helix transcriptional regulator [Sciscionella marina]